MRYARLLPRAVALLAVALSASCAAELPGFDPAPEPIPPAPENAVRCDQAPERPAPVAILPRVGGYVALNRHLLDIPPGTVTDPTRVQMVQPEADYVLLQILHDRPVGPGPLLRMSATHCADIPEGELAIAYWNPDALGGGAWEILESGLPVDPLGKRAAEPAAVARLQHLSSYALVSAN